MFFRCTGSMQRERRFCASSFGVRRFLAFFSRLPPCLVGLEACATAHYWARELRALGHEVRLMPAQYVKAYVKRNKNDAADAAAICEAHGTGAGACERAMTRDGTVGRSDATERSLPFHWDIDPARMMRPRFADSIRASSPLGLREQAGHMTASDFCAARYIFRAQCRSRRTLERGRPRAKPALCCRTGGQQAGCDLRLQLGGGGGTSAREPHAADRVHRNLRSGGERLRGELGASGWECHGLHQLRTDDGGEVDGGAQGDRAAGPAGRPDVQSGNCPLRRRVLPASV